MAGNNGTASLHRPTAPRVAGQYTRIQDQVFAPASPAQHGVAQPIPSNTQGNTGLAQFSKINKALTPGPIARIVIKTQQARF
jgi:hypothetical protein